MTPEIAARRKPRRIVSLEAFCTKESSIRSVERVGNEEHEFVMFFFFPLLCERRG